LVDTLEQLTAGIIELQDLRPIQAHIDRRKSTDVSKKHVASFRAYEEAKPETGGNYGSAFTLVSLLDYSSILKMEAIFFSETSAGVHRTT
jgi:hypothetical protein